MVDLSKRKMHQLKRNEIADLPRKLEAWFGARMDNAKNLELVTVNRTSGEAGMSAEMFIVQLRWLDVKASQQRQEKYVVRVELTKPANPASNSNFMM